jgi:hypothetical protein
MIFRMAFRFELDSITQPVVAFEVRLVYKHTPVNVPFVDIS